MRKREAYTRKLIPYDRDELREFVQRVAAQEGMEKALIVESNMQAAGGIWQLERLR